MKFSCFADNFSTDSGILQLMSDLEVRCQSKQEIHVLGGGNPAKIPAMEQLFRNEMLGVMNNDRQFEDMLCHYDAPQGNRFFSTALVDLMNQSFGWNIDTRNIAITNGSQSSFGILFNLFSGEFEDQSFKQVLLPLTPEYIGYGDVGLGRRPIFKSNRPVINCSGNDSLMFKYRVDFENLEIDENIGAICVSRPTNPTGNVISDNELGKLIDLSTQHQVPLILDGAYGQPFPGIIFTDATLPQWQDNLIICLSLSKLGLPGVRTGIVIANAEVITKIKASNAIYNLSPGAFGPTLISNKVANGALLKVCQDVITPFYKTRVTQVVTLIRELFSDIPVRIHQPEGAIFLWLWFEDLPVSSSKLYEDLKSLGVYVIDGQHFFTGLDHDWRHKYECIRVSYTSDWHNIEQGFRIISERVHLLYSNNNA